MPAPGGRDFLQAYNCQAVVDSAHQVIVAAQATNQLQNRVPKRCPPTLFYHRRLKT